MRKRGTGTNTYRSRLHKIAQPSAVSSYILTPKERRVYVLERSSAHARKACVPRVNGRLLELRGLSRAREKACGRTSGGDARARISHERAAAKIRERAYRSIGVRRNRRLRFTVERNCLVIYKKKKFSKEISSRARRPKRTLTRKALFTFKRSVRKRANDTPVRENYRRKIGRAAVSTPMRAIKHANIGAGSLTPF